MSPRGARTSTSTAGPGRSASSSFTSGTRRDAATLRLTGWWGNDPATRFQMAETFEPAPGAEGWRISTPPILSLAPIRVVAGDLRRGRAWRRLRAKSVAAHRLPGTADRRARAGRRDPDAARPGQRAAPSCRCGCPTRAGGWTRSRRSTSSPTSASRTSSGWHRSRCTARTSTPGGRPWPSRRRLAEPLALRLNV